MKKVFAILSALALMIALVGAVSKTNNAVKADRKFVEDPTLSENEIPLYIMNSIYSTFPTYYDNEAEADPNWDGPARMYPWNETRLQVRLIDGDGAFTGQEYAIYFGGGLSASSGGAGYNLVFFDVDESGNPVAKRMDNGKWGTGNGTAMDPSLSHMRTNLADVPVTFDPDVLLAGSEGSQFLNRVLVFDANGRMVRGLMGNPGYLAEGAEGALDNVFAPEYCYVDGVVTKAEEGVVCDKVLEPQLDENGDPVVDGNGDPVLVETEKDNYLYTRFLWQWVSADEYDADEVNTVPYLSEGWDATKWDYANYEESSNGYILIGFLPSENSTTNLTAEQIAVYPDGEAPAKRTFAQTITVPAHGFTFDFGYLDKGKTPLYNAYEDMFESGYYFGRNVDAEGKGMAYQKTFDFSASPLYTTDQVVNGTSFQTLEGQNTIEVLQGETIIPAKNVVYTGMSRYWQTPNDLTSFSADTSVLDMTISVDGVTVVQPSTGYTSFADMVADFIKDWNEYCDGNEDLGESRHITVTPNASQTDEEIVSSFYEKLGWDLASTGAKADAFTALYWAKWGWMFEFINTKCQAAGVNTVDWKSNGAVTSPGSSRDALWGFLAESPKRSIAGTYANTGVDFSGGVAREWLDERTNLEKWNQFSIDTSTSPVDTNFNVKYLVANSVTGNSSELSIKYVVVDEYTPILKVNVNNLNFTPSMVDDKAVVNPIDKFTFCTAYNGAYNGKSIRGDEISQKVHYESDTLDFDNPTEGEHKVTATVYSASGAKFVTKSFVVSIEDMTAPRVFTRDLVLAYGSYYTPTLGVTFAYDAVDGNLMNNDFRGWWTDASSTIVNVQKPGSYTQVLEISDRSGNITKVSYKVTILEAPTSAALSGDVSDVADQVAALQQSLKDVKSLVEDVQSQVAELKAASAQPAKKCGSKSALLLEFLAAASLLGVFLKKRH